MELQTLATGQRDKEKNRTSQGEKCTKHQIPRVGGVGVATQKWPKPPPQNKKSSVDNILSDDAEDNEDTKELSEKHKGREDFYDMEKINMEREKEREAMEQIESERKVKAARLKATWELARLCREILRESES